MAVECSYDGLGKLVDLYPGMHFIVGPDVYIRRGKGFSVRYRGEGI